MMKQMSVDSGNEASSEDSNDSLRSSRKRVIPERENNEGVFYYFVLWNFIGIPS